MLTTIQSLLESHDPELEGKAVAEAKRTLLEMPADEHERLMCSVSQMMRGDAVLSVSENLTLGALLFVGLLAIQGTATQRIGSEGYSNKKTPASR